MILSECVDSQPNMEGLEGFAVPEVLLRDAVKEAHRGGKAIVVGHTRAVPKFDPIAVFQRFVDQGGYGQLWIAPDGTALVGLGQAGAIQSRGPGRFQASQRKIATLLDGARLHAETGSAPVEPIYMGGFAFDPEYQPAGQWDGFPSAQLVLPRILYRCHGSDATLSTYEFIDPGAGLREARAGGLSEPGQAWVPEDDHQPMVAEARQSNLDFAAWEQAVERLRGKIRQGPLAKAVLARTLRVRNRNGMRWGETLYRLQRRFGDCYLFAVARGDRCFLGATPEQLAQVKGTQLRTMGLAGSIRRGSDEAEDERLGRALLDSPKEREEHQLVVKALQEGVTPLCTELHVPNDGPGLRKLANVQHLYTPVRGTLRAGVSILDVLDRIHPTPAVGGYPRKTAMEAIRQAEPEPRGWYAGPVGWLNGAGEGEFAVAIRSALLQGDQACLFAGCGIVEASDPVEEFAESELKLDVLLAALGGEST